MQIELRGMRQSNSNADIFDGAWIRHQKNNKIYSKLDNQIVSVKMKRGEAESLIVNYLLASYEVVCPLHSCPACL